MALHTTMPSMEVSQCRDPQQAQQDVLGQLPATLEFIFISCFLNFNQHAFCGEVDACCSSYMKCACTRTHRQNERKASVRSEQTKSMHASTYLHLGHASCNCGERGALGVTLMVVHWRKMLSPGSFPHRDRPPHTQSTKHVVPIRATPWPGLHDVWVDLGGVLDVIIGVEATHARGGYGVISRPWREGGTPLPTNAWLPT